MSKARVDRSLRLLLGALDRVGRRLAIELRADRLLRGGPGIRVASGLAHRLLELRDLAAARTGLRSRRGFFRSAAV